LEELDSLFLRASRNDPEALVESMKGKINTALNALERWYFKQFIYYAPQH
jgi:hypothetical protein